MSRERGCPRHPDILTPREWEVLEFLRQGQTNEGIAAALNVSLSTAKYHVAEILSKTGARDRHEAVRLADQRRQSWLALPAFSRLLSNSAPAKALSASPVVPISAATLAAVALVLLLSFGVPFGSPGDPSAGLESSGLAGGLDIPAEDTDVSRSALSCPDAASAGLGVVTAEELETEGLSKAGPLIETSGCPLFVSNRFDRAIVEVPSGTRVLIAGADERRGLPELVLKLAGEEFRIIPRVTTAQSFPVLLRRPDSFVIEHRDQTFTLIFIAEDGEAEAHRVAVSSAGDLYVEEQALPADTALDIWSGEQIDLRSMEFAGRLENTGRTSDFFFTSCDQDTSLCRVVFRQVGTKLRAPVAGNLRCVSDEDLILDDQGNPVGEFEIDAGSFVLRLREEYATSQNTNTSWQCAARSVMRDEVISTHDHFSLTAQRQDGSPLSIVVSQSGLLYVGDVGLNLGCPCVSSN